MGDTTGTEPNWLERMHSFLTWKVMGFDFNNPYEKKISDKVLAELVADIDVLKKYTRVRGLVDGEEIVTVKNLKELLIETDHPSLSKFRKSDLEKYLDHFGVRQEWDRQLVNIQKDCREELERRKRTPRSGY